MIGTYKGKAIAFTLDTIGENGNLAVQIRWGITGEGVRPISTHWLTDAGMEFSIKAFRAAGWKGSQITDFGDPDTPIASLFPDEVELVLYEEPWIDKEGKNRITTKVQYVNRIGSSTLTAKHAPSKAALLTMAGKFKAAAAKDPATATATATAAADEDPFDGDDFENL
jgi:hypothetical protein